MQSNTLEQALLREIKDFTAEHSIAPSTFGKEALGDGSFVKDLEDGKRSPTAKTIEKVRQHIRDRQQGEAK